MPEPVHRRPNPVPAGSLTRELSNRVDDHPPMIAPPVVVNVMWMLNAFTAANGATRIVPGSHLYGRRPDAERDKDVVSIPAEGVAGSAGQRLGILSTFVAPQFRTQANFTLATAPEVVADADDDLLALLGFKIWNAYGRIESPVAGYIQQGERSLGEMRPS